MEIPQGIDSKFRYILVAARRARELQAGSMARVQNEGRKMTVIAQRELCAGCVPFEVRLAPGKAWRTLT